MITENDLKSKCTPEFIKWMCEMAEGFELSKDEYNCEIVIFYSMKEFVSKIKDNEFLFPLLIHRAIEGWNKNQDNSGNCIVIQDESVILWMEKLDDCKTFDFENYQPQLLTPSECAGLDCLIDVFGEEMRLGKKWERN